MDCLTPPPSVNDHGSELAWTWLAPAETDDHNVYLLTVIDTFSRWPIAIPLPNKKAETIADALCRHLICVHGCAEEHFPDQEATLLAEAVSRMCKKIGIKKKLNSLATRLGKMMLAAFATFGVLLFLSTLPDGTETGIDRLTVSCLRTE